jgi:hypothetical protein
MFRGKEMMIHDHRSAETSDQTVDPQVALSVSVLGFSILDDKQREEDYSNKQKRDSDVNSKNDHLSKFN